MEYHLRLSTTKQNGLTLLNAYLGSFKCADVVSAFEFTEIKEDGTVINPHCHAYIKYNKAPTKQDVSAFFKKWKSLLLKPNDKTPGYSHKVQKTTKEQNIIYTIKGGDIIMNTIGDAILSYKEKTELINENKKLSSKEKLYNIYCQKYGIKYPDSKFGIYKFIDEVYVIDWDKTPLAIGHKLCYGIYILMKIHKNIAIKNNRTYDQLLMNLYQIKEEDHRILLSEINKDKLIDKLKEDEELYNKLEFID